MKKIISTIVTVGFISTMLISTAYAGDRYSVSILNPLWLPAAILTTLAAVTTPAPVQPVVYEPRAYYAPQPTVVYEAPRPTVIYEEPRYYRHDYSYGPYRAYEGPRYRYYR
jgi:hypothetical protein